MNKEVIDYKSAYESALIANGMLRKENKELHNKIEEANATIDTNLELIDHLSNKIDKAIEYIDNNVAVYAFNNKDLPHWEFDDDDIEMLLKILKDGDVDE